MYTSPTSCAHTQQSTTRGASPERKGASPRAAIDEHLEALGALDAALDASVDPLPEDPRGLAPAVRRFGPELILWFGPPQGFGVDVAADPALDICGTALRCFNEDGESTVIELVAEDAAIKFGTLLRWPISPTLAHGTLMIRARFFASRRYDTSKRYCEDAALYLDAALAGPVRFANLPEVLYDYRVHSGSVSVAFQEAQREEHIDMLCRTMLAEGALAEGELDDYRALLRFRPRSVDERGRARIDRIFARLEDFALRHFSGCSPRAIAEHATRVRARWWERVRGA